MYSSEYYSHAYCFAKNVLSFRNININFFFINIEPKNILRDMYFLWSLDIKNQEVFYHENINWGDFLWSVRVIIQEPVF